MSRALDVCPPSRRHLCFAGAVCDTQYVSVYGCRSGLSGSLGIDYWHADPWWSLLTFPSALREVWVYRIRL